MRPTHRWARVALVGVSLVCMVLLFDASFRMGSSRQVSVDQLKENIVSIYSDEAEGVMVSTREWRLEWWGKIIDYTVKGPYFWTGKGFGVNLFTSDINPGATEARLRSPHNGHMTVLARMGVPGFVLWILLHGVFAISLLRAYARARSGGQELWARINVWLLAYWVAFMVNGSFDVYLEGPQGGIWFWSLFGMGIAVLRMQQVYPTQTRTGGPIQAAGPPPRERLVVSG